MWVPYNRIKNRIKNLKFKKQYKAHELETKKEIDLNKTYEFIIKIIIFK